MKDRCSSAIRPEKIDMTEEKNRRRPQVLAPPMAQWKLEIERHADVGH